MKLLVCDYDGTFYTDEENIQLNIQKIKEWMCNGDLFMISSGRCFNSILDKIVKYDIPIDFISSADGSHLFDRNSNIIFEKMMDSKILEKLNKIIDIGAHTELQFGTRKDYLINLPDDKLISSMNFKLDRNNVPNIFLSEWNSLKKENKDYSFFVYSYGDISYYCIKPKGINKSSPISYLEKNIPLLKSDIYTVGDGDNDICMIKDFNGYVIGDNLNLKKHALERFDEVYYLVDDINNQKVKRRWK